MNVAMWGRALSVIPRVSKEEWAELDIVSRWLIATRSAVIIMTAIASGIAGLLAFRDGLFDAVLWGLCTLGLCFAHATNNLVNDLTDHKKGVDKDNYFRTQYGPQPLEHGLMTTRQVLKYAAFTGLVALAAGALLVAQRGQATLTLFAIGIFFVLFYTWPLKYIGMGEPAVLVVWGPLMVGGTYYVVTGRFDWQVALASLPFALGATAVLFGKHIDKLEADRGKHIRTLPVLLGERASRAVTIAMLLCQYALVGYLVLTRYFSPVLLSTLGAVPALWLALKAYRFRRPAKPPPELPPNVWPLWFVAFAFHHTRRFGLLYVLGLVADVVLRKMGLVGP
ncbi:MAG: prenyltransferase [Polyangiaceae bacterium]|nr:prenyltransferase [Polyangiaceae bacterium]MCE7888132.1 prenyltransferase [Sorangiineae bacterium PRO1]MCL4750951.1 prenyltransferase [Myxococcales bacterium]